MIGHLELLLQFVSQPQVVSPVRIHHILKQLSDFEGGILRHVCMNHLQVIWGVEELAILPTTGTFLYVVVARHNSIAVEDG